MFGSNWSVCLRATPYRSILEALENHVEGFVAYSCARLLDDTAALSYRLGKPGAESVAILA